MQVRKNIRQNIRQSILLLNPVKIWIKPFKITSRGPRDTRHFLCCQHYCQHFSQQQKTFQNKSTLTSCPGKISFRTDRLQYRMGCVLYSPSPPRRCPGMTYGKQCREELDCDTATDIKHCQVTFYTFFRSLA